MRPLRVTMRGFRSHLEDTSIDFEGRNLIAIVGPTGAGKSSILDAISYSLYAKTPREKRSSASLISSRAKKAGLTYRFAIGGSVYEINRTIPAASDDYMVEEGSGDKVIGSSAITARVEELLGLDFTGFSSSVLLAQGQFDLFLKATTKERTLILKGIFRIERIDELRKAAAARRSSLDSELAMIEGERKQIPDNAADQIRSEKAEVAELTHRIVQLEKALPEESTLMEREKEAAADKASAEKEMLELGDAIKTLPRLDMLEELTERETSCVATTKEATATFDACSKAAAQATKDLERLLAKLGDVKVLHSARAQAEGVAKRSAEIARIEDEMKGLEKLVAASASALEEVASFEEAAKAALSDARAKVDELNRVHAAHALRETLEPGEPCPVCEQEVDTVPKIQKAGDVSEAQEAAVTAEAALDQARAAVVDAKKAAAAEQQRLESLGESHKRAVADRAEAMGAIKDVVGSAKDPVAEIDARLEKLDAAVEQREAALKSRDEAQRSLNGCALVKQDLDRERQRHAAVLIQLAVKLGVPAPSVEDPAAALMKKAVSMSERAEERGEELDARLEKASVMVRETAESLAELRKSAAVEGSFTDALAEAKKNQAVKHHVIEELTKKIARAKELNQEEKEIRARRALFERLAEDLTDRHFVNFLLEDRRRLLSELASERFREMTNRYRFSDDGEFNVVDELEGDIERGTDTLSGGESFLASLALALGLAETATRQGGRLQCFFLDEGFGSLDPESFDLALDGIERIVMSDRLIGLVSHVPALAARVEDKIVLAKDAEGSSIVQAGASR